MWTEFTADTSGNREEIDALKARLDIGCSFIDIAEMYDTGHAWELVFHPTSDIELLVATEVWQKNLGYDDVLRASNRSMSG